MTDQLIQQLRMLKLCGMREHLEARIQEAERNDLSYAEFLSMVVSDEVEMRTNRRISRLLHHAGLGAEKTLETFDFTFAPSVNAIRL
jgi:DNA replication protein DnaC